LISDVDICVFLKPGKYRRDQLHGKRMMYVETAVNDKADVQIFQQLPVQVRSTVLKEAKWILVKDEGALYDLAMQTVKDFEDFRRHYEQYLAGVANAKPG
jgi:hypothetical protein